MQLLGWPFHSGWMLLTVVSVCCCIDIGSPSVGEDALDGRAVSWSELRRAGALRKYHSMADVGGGDEDGGDEPDDAVMDDAADDDDDYIYDVEGRPLHVEQYQFYYKPSGAKRSSSSSLKRQQTTPGRRASAKHAPASAGAEPEPRALALLGSHAAVAKLNRQKEAILKKILRQAARRQSMKRSPNCMRKCIAQGLLHPAQCHSLC